MELGILLKNLIVKVLMLEVLLLEVVMLGSIFKGFIIVPLIFQIQIMKRKYLVLNSYNRYLYTQTCAM